MAVCLAAAACGRAAHKTATRSANQLGSRRVAVLPFDNQSVDLAGPGIVRGLVTSRLADLGYQPLGADEVDAKLRELGITDGGQLKTLTPKDIGKALGVEGLFYGTLEEFNFTNVGFYLSRVVRVRLRLVSADTGEALWENTGQDASRELHVKEGKAKKAFVRGVARKALENMTNTALAKESREAVRKLLRSAPRSW